MSLTFCITGTLSRSRDEFKTYLEARGHKVSSSVTSKIDYLLAGYDAGSKLDKALDMGIKVIAEAQLNGVLAQADAKPFGAPPAGPATRTIYHFYTEEHGENEAMFDESFNILGAWHCNDATFRWEYMRGWLKALDIVVKPLPESRAESALEALCDEMGYGDDFGG